jgi:RHS repeat-associated protein
MKDALGRTTTSYDAAGRVTVQAQPTIKRVSYSYDAADRRTYVTDPDGGRTSYTHDSAGQLTLVNAPGAGRTSLAYDSAGRLLTRLAGGGARISHTYDNAGQLLVVASSNTSGLVNRFSYSYDNASRRTLMKQSDGTRTTYAYDAAGQLTREWRTGGVLAVNATFSYDPAGNRTLLIDSGLRTTSSYDAANQHTLDVASSGRTTYSYDQAGNRSQKNGPSGLTAYTWDGHNRLTQVAPPTNPVTLSYDGDGRRMKKQTASTTRQFVYDFEKVLQETDGGGATQQQYASTEEQYGELLSSWGGGQARYYGFDGLGSTDALLALDGTTPDRYAYRAFGQATHYQGTSDNRFDWVGRQGYYDDSEVGLYYVRERYYDPATARWLSKDRDGADAGDSNLYRYVGNASTQFADPSGRVATPVAPDDILSARTAFGPRADLSGSYYWSIRWELSKPACATNGGIVLQHVRQRISFREPTGKRLTASEFQVTDQTLTQAGPVYQSVFFDRFFEPTKYPVYLNYWEAWEVMPGKNVPTPKETGTEMINGKLFNDRYSLFTIRVTGKKGVPIFGFTSIIGTAYYLDNLKIANLMLFGFWNFGNGSPAGPILSASKADGDAALAYLRRYPGVTVSKALDHILLVSWPRPANAKKPIPTQGVIDYEYLSAELGDVRLDPRDR